MSYSQSYPQFPHRTEKYKISEKVNKTGNIK